MSSLLELQNKINILLYGIVRWGFSGGLPSLASGLVRGGSEAPPGRAQTWVHGRMDTRVPLHYVLQSNYHLL